MENLEKQQVEETSVVDDFVKVIEEGMAEELAEKTDFIEDVIDAALAIDEIENAEEAANAVIEEGVEVIPSEPFKVFLNEEEFKKELQSVSGKAKNEILKELGVNSIKDFKDKFAQLTENEKLVGDLAEAKELIEKMQSERLYLENELISSKFSLADEKAKEVFIGLVQAQKGDRHFLEVAAEIYETLKNGFSKAMPTKVVIGSERNESRDLEDAFTVGFKNIK